MNFSEENFNQHKTETDLEWEFILKAAYKKAIKILYDQRPRMDNPRLEKYYEKEPGKINADKEKLRELLSKFNLDESKKMATVLEVIFIDQIKQNIGDRINTMPASVYDDVKHGIDLFLEFTHSDKKHSQAAVALDITFANKISSKIERIKKEIDEGNLAQTDYALSDADPKFIGKVKDIPHFVVSIGGDKARKLIIDWIELDENKRNEKFSESNTLFNFLEQILRQAEVFRKYALQGGRGEVAKKMTLVIDMLKPVYEQLCTTENKSRQVKDRSYKILDEVVGSKFTFVD